MAQDTRQLMEAAFSAHRSGRLTECEEQCRRVLKIDPRNVDAKLLSGVIAAKTGKNDLAIKRLEEVVRWDPRNFVALNWLSMLLRESNRLSEATGCAERAVSLRSQDADALNNLGLCYLAQFRYLDAIPCFRRAIALRPNQPFFHYGLAFALEPLGRTADAAEALRKAIKFSPDANWLLQLGNMCLGEGQYQEAIECCHRALEFDANLPLAHLLLSQALADQDELERADYHFQKALELDPKPSEIYKIRGLRRQSTGRFEEARCDFANSVEIEPNQGFAYYGIVSSARVTHEDKPLLERMETVLAAGTLSPTESTYVYYALGKAFDNLGEYDRAMNYFDEANRLSRETKLGNRPFDRERFSARIDDTIRVFSREFFKRNIDVGSDSALPILVVGMMRSGTTLLEQILSCHSQVGGAGEQSFWTHIQPTHVNFEAGTVDAHAIIEAGEHYCGMLETIAPGNRRVTDKNPANFFALGPIHLALPRAKIIHTVRNPVDTCLSIYMTPVRTPPEFACDRENIVFAYRQYLKLMDHWRSVIPSDCFLDVSYRDLIQDRAASTRRVVAFCGLEWDEKCLRPEENIRSIRTPSFWQARQPVYTTSLHRWKRYLPCLGAFEDLLE